MLNCIKYLLEHFIDADFFVPYHNLIFSLLSFLSCNFLCKDNRFKIVYPLCNNEWLTNDDNSASNKTYCVIQGLFDLQRILYDVSNTIDWNNDLVKWTKQSLKIFSAI